MGFAGDIEQRVLDRGDGLLVQSAARLAGQDVQVLRHLLEHARVAADQDRGQAADDIGQSDGAKAFVELRPADDAFVRRDLEEGKHAPAGVGLERLDPRDLHWFPPDGRLVGMITRMGGGCPATPLDPSIMDEVQAWMRSRHG